MFRRKRRRKKGAPTLKIEGLTATQLGAKVGLTARGVRFYIAKRLLPSAHFRGSATRYLREHLVRLAAIRKLQRDEDLDLDVIRARIEALAPAELERIAATYLPELSGPPAAAAQAAPTSAVQSPARSQVTWSHIAILPGLEIHVRSDASPHVQRMVGEIETHFLGGAARAADG